ncbi:tetratricopeptide repeat protein [Desulfoluna sp.]|uniref:tetratricopeptide repeat protein n=1 Tax=Desulfoluna sp. TaxID=2045199 RepID=UPI0026229F16|nr:tetratricopeptide repeat protein [Desulfoluna sp.]
MRNRRVLFAGAFFLVLTFCATLAASATDEVATFPEGYTQDRYLKDKEKAEDGDARAQFIMGYLHHRQVVPFVTPDIPTAFSWYQKSALQGHIQASQILGAMYQKGEGADVDLQAAKRYFQYAADRGMPEAACALGLLYTEGQGVPRDDELAVFWLKRADKQNFSPAAMTLGVMCAGGRGVAKDMTVAFAWFVRSAELGNAEGMYQVAGMYRTGNGVAQDIGISIRWLEEALKVTSRISMRAINDLAWTLATCPDERYRDSKRAMELGGLLLDALSQRTPSHLDTVAAVYAVNGLFKQAIDIQEEAIQALAVSGEANLEAPLRERLELYKQGKIWIDP